MTAAERPVGLTNQMAETLIRLRDFGTRSAYPGLSLGTLEALKGRGLVTATYGAGSIAMPANAIKWTITPAGRAILAQEGE